MVAADAIAIGVGKVLGTRLPERAIRIGAAVAFVVFGLDPDLAGRPRLTPRPISGLPSDAVASRQSRQT